MNKVVYVMDYCGGRVVEYESLEAANKAEGFVHVDDTYDNKLFAMEKLLRETREDLVEQTRLLREAKSCVNMDLRNIDRLVKDIKKEKRKLGKERGALKRKSLSKRERK